MERNNVRVIHPPLERELPRAAYFERTPDAVVVADADGRIADANEAALRLAGVGLERLRGQPAAESLPLPPEGDAAQWSRLALGRGGSAYVWRRPPAGVDALRNAHLELLDIDRRKTDFLAMIAHDIRAPLGVILGGLGELAARMPPQRTGEKALHALIRRSVERLRRLAENILDLSLLEAGRIELCPRVFDLRTLLAQVIEEMDKHESAQRVRLEADSLDEPVPVVADRDRVAQVLSNLFSNGIRHARSKVSARLVTKSEEVLLEVADDGLGIPVEALGRIFERFERASARERRGAGLGLAIVRGIVEAHGGTVHAENHRDVNGAVAGARFLVWLPRVARVG